MSLFEVKDWEVPSQTTATASLSQSSRKRKRPANDADRVQSAQVNVEKLMRKVVKEGLEPGKETKRKRKNKPQKGKGHPPGGTPHEEGTKLKPRDKKGKGKISREGGGESTAEESRNNGDTSSHPSKRARKKGPSDLFSAPPKPNTEHAPSGLMHKKKVPGKARPSVGLTSMQSSMKDSLDGARFR
jgi:ribosomal RNA-processing protein 8